MMLIAAYFLLLVGFLCLSSKRPSLLVLSMLCSVTAFVLATLYLLELISKYSHG